MVDESKVLPQARNAYEVPSEIFYMVIGYSTRAFPQGGLDTFADFFDVKNSPVSALATGKTRHCVLEAALMDDGVAAKDVYKTLSTEASMTRELNKIRQIKPYVAMWWFSGAQPVQALASGEVAMALGWNGRF